MRLYDCHDVVPLLHAWHIRLSQEAVIKSKEIERYKVGKGTTRVHRCRSSTSESVWQACVWQPRLVEQVWEGGVCWCALLMRGRDVLELLLFLSYSERTEAVTELTRRTGGNLYTKGDHEAKVPGRDFASRFLIHQKQCNLNAYEIAELFVDSRV